MKIEVSVSGQIVIQDFFKTFNQQFMERIERALNLASSLIEGQAKELVPVDTGRLKNSITHRISKSEHRIDAEVGTNVAYAPYVEFPTKPHFPPVSAIANWVEHKGRGAGSGFPSRKERSSVNAVAFLIARKIAIYGTKGQPYLRPAFEKKYEQATGIVVNELESLLKGD